MRVSRNWLGEHVDLTGLTAEEIAHRLTFAGVEVEAMEERGGDFSGVVVAAICKSEPHPNAERLSVCAVDDGSGTLRQIVCGAKNYAVGDHVPLALPGAELPGGARIRATELRGVQSDGMLCSGVELGMGDDGSGLLILDRETRPGQAFADLFENDVLFELEITPNRPDLLSHRGIARELAAATGREFGGAPALSGEGAPVRVATAEEVRLDAAELCPLYTARRIRGVKAGPSPDWLRRRLESIGVRSVNNVVDVTNFVLFETGQPLHAFDLNRLQGGIVVRRGEAGESFLALDGETYLLTGDDVVIADHRRAVAIGGVMGGEESGVTEDTSDLLLESACFLPAAIRRTSRRLGLSSDSSYRFERGVDPCQTVGAADLATRLILDLAGGTAEEVLTAGSVALRRGALRYDYCQGNRLLGIEMAPAEVDAILSRLGLRRQSGDERESWWEIPSYRLDLERSVDLIEEVARMHGLDNVPGRRAALLPGRSKVDVRYDALMQLRTSLAGAGLLEARTMKLVAAAQLPDDVFGLRKSGGSEAVPLRNPLSDDHTFMRPSLIPGLLAAAERNARMGSHALRFFELGAVFSQHPKSPAITEAEHAAILLGGSMESRNWLTPRPRAADFAGLRGILEGLAGSRARVTLRRRENQALAVCAEVLLEKTVVGQAGMLWPARSRELGWESGVFLAELDLSKWMKGVAALDFVEPLPRYPSVSRDVALEVAADMPAGEVGEFLNRLQEPILEEVLLFDLFQDSSGEKLALGRKSLAYSLTYRSPERTLTSEEVDALHREIVERLVRKFDARVR